MNDSSIFEKYDLTDVDESFPIPEIPPEGLILIHGTSGSGKTTILKTLFGEAPVTFDDRPLYLNFSTEEKAEELLIACGLRTVPAWRRPYSQLSNGEQHRAYCAKCIDEGMECMDEFTSVVDRDTAKALSYAIQKYFRKSGMKRLVLATCHADIIEWLNPDHAYNTDTKEWEDTNLPRGCLHRPNITLTIRAERNNEDFWGVFKKHHYLSGKHNKAANAFVVHWDGKLVGFTSILRYPSGTVKNAWREHRTVILPEFQGLGIGSAVSDTIGQMVIDSGGRYFSKTSHPAFGTYRDNSPRWRPTSKNHSRRPDYGKHGMSRKYKGMIQHRNRMCYSHEYIGDCL